MDDFGYRRPWALDVGIGIEKFTPHRGQKYKMIGKAEILLSDLKLRHQLRFWHRAKQWMERLARLKVDGPILHLQQHVRRELTVERLQIVIGRRGAIVTGLRVVNEGPPDHH